MLQALFIGAKFGLSIFGGMVAQHLPSALGYFCLM
jgi:hypothetical protein